MSAFWAGRRVLVTGHTGFKGGWLTLWLGAQGAAVTGIGLAPLTEPNLFRLAVDGNCDSRLVDIRDAGAVRDAVAEAAPSVVFHLAAQALVRPSYADPLGTYATNVMGTAHVLEAVRATAGIEAVVVATSDKAYRNREWHWGYREDEPMGGHDPYSSSKGCAELVAAAYRASFLEPGGTCRLATARAGNVIGGGDWSAERLVPDAIRAFQDGEAVAIRHPGAVRPWQHVLEPLAGYMRLAEALAGPEGATFADGWNFGPAEADCRPVADVVGALAAAMNGEWRHVPDGGPHEATFLKLDSSKARALLGWQPRLRLDEALSWTAEWYRTVASGGDARRATLDQITRYAERMAA